MSEPVVSEPEFDQFAESYDEVLNTAISASGEDKNFFAEGRIRWLAGLLEQRGFAPQNVLDFGCGTGTATTLFHQFFGTVDVTGVDVSPASLDVARRDHEELGQHAKFIELEKYQPEGTTDLAFCNGVFHHIPLAERAQAMSCVFESLRPGGLFAFWENNPWNPGARYCMWVNPFDKDAIMLSPVEARQRMKTAGFRILRTDSIFFFPRPLAWLRRFEPSLSRFPLGAQYLVLAERTR